MWNVLETGRWQADGPLRHLLLQAGTRMVEFHDDTVHVYEVTGPVDAAHPLGDPADTEAVEPFGRPVARWVSSDVRPDLVDASDDTVWTTLTGSDYTEAAQ